MSSYRGGERRYSLCMEQGLSISRLDIFGTTNPALIRHVNLSISFHKAAIMASTELEGDYEYPELHLSSGTESEEDPWNLSLPEDEILARKIKIKQAKEFIATLYASGKPIFTKDAIQSLVSQIDDSNSKIKGGELSQEFFSVPGLDNNTVEVVVKTGSIRCTAPRHDKLEDVRYTYT